MNISVGNIIFSNILHGTNYLTSCIICRIQDALTKLQNAINSKRVEVFAPNEVWEVNITPSICFDKELLY